MRKFLRRLKKGFKTACLTTALVTCWNIGHSTPVNAALNFGDPITMKFSGTVSPATNDISNLYLILVYGSGSSSIGRHFSAVKLGDFTANQTTAFTVYDDTIYRYSLYWATAGLYGDTSGGQYNANINGVTIAKPGIDPGESWDSHMFTNINTMFDYLLNDNEAQLAQYHCKYFYYDDDYDYTSSGETVPLYDFSTATANGEMFIQYEIVPEPTSLVLFAAGVYIFSRYRRRDED